MIGSLLRVVTVASVAGINSLAGPLCKGPGKTHPTVFSAMLLLTLHWALAF